MTARTYTTKAGLKRFRPVIDDPDELEGNLGFCLACGQSAENVEPDAREYRCEGCGERKVYGLEELLMMGIARMES